MKVVFHIDEMNKWSLVIGNVKNTISYCKENNIKYRIEVVANSEAVKGYLSNFEIEGIAYLQKLHVEFVACNNAIRNYEIQLKELISGITVVPAGIIELVLKQQDGYAYIRP